MANNLTFTITLQLKGQNEVEKLFQEVQQPHATSVSVDTSGVQSGIQNLQNPIKSMIDNLKTGFAQIGFVISGVKQSISLIRGMIDPLVAASNVQEDAVTSLNASLRNTGIDVDSVSPKLQAYASNIQKLTRYGDELILSGTALAQNIGQFGEDVLPDVQTAAVGLATRFKMDLRTAFELIGRAAKGQTGTLTRYGIVLDSTKTKEEQLSELLKLGADGFSIAKEEAQNGAGALQQYSNLVGDLKEKIGDIIKSALVPIVKQLSIGITAASDFFRSLTETSLERTIREMQDLGVNIETIQRLKKLQLKTEIMELNSELAKTNDSFGTTEDMVAEIERIEAQLSLQAELTAEAKARAAENAANENGAAADALDTYKGIQQLSEAELQNLEKKLKKYTNQLNLLTSLETKQKQLNALDTETEKKETKTVTTTVTVSQEEIDKAKAQIDAFFLSISSKKEQLAADYATKKSLLETAFVNDPEALKQKMTELDAWYSGEQEKLRQEEINAEKNANLEIARSVKEAHDEVRNRYEAEMKLIETKKNLGLATEQELMAVQTEYTNWLKDTYGEDSQQYLAALNNKKTATEQFWQENHKLGSTVIDTLINGFNSMWDTILDASMSGRERLDAIWQSMKKFFVNAIGDMVATYLKGELTKIAMAETTAATEIATSKESTAVQNANILTTIALKIKSAIVSIGQAVASGFEWLVSTLGPVGLAAGIALGAGIIAAFSAIRSQLGFASGGYTGDGNKTEAAGIVHKKELVLEESITTPNLQELLGLRKLLQKGYKLKDLLMPTVQIPAVSIPTAQVAFAGGGYSGSGTIDFSAITKRLESIEKTLKNKQLSGTFEMKDKRSGVDRYEVFLKDQIEYGKKLK